MKIIIIMDIVETYTDFGYSQKKEFLKTINFNKKNNYYDNAKSKFKKALRKYKESGKVEGVGEYTFASECAYITKCHQHTLALTEIERWKKKYENRDTELLKYTRLLEKKVADLERNHLEAPEWTFQWNSPSGVPIETRGGKIGMRTDQHLMPKDNDFYKDIDDTLSYNYADDVSTQYRKQIQEKLMNQF